MKPLIYYRDSGKMFVDGKLAGHYIMKIPTRVNRLAGTGSAGLKMAEKYDLEHNKKGILYIDQSLRAYVIVPKEFLTEWNGKSCNGIKNSIFSYPIGEIMVKHNLELVKIPYEKDIVQPHQQGLAGEIRGRFGL